LKEEDVTIADLKIKFESLGVKPPKSLLLSRFIVEPKSGNDLIVLNE
jgi:hypothetical protein